MTYKITYRETPPGVDPPPVAPDAVDMTVPKHSKVIDVMEKAVAEYGNNYSFTASYTQFTDVESGDLVSGFFLDKLNGTAGTSPDSEGTSYYWKLVLDHKGADEGMSDASIKDVSTVTWRYVKYTPPEKK